MAQSYSNPGGSGDRRYGVIDIAGDITWVSDAYLTLDGTTTNNVFWTAGTTLSWDFGEPRVVDECTFRQSAATTHGTWKWQRSSDNATWTDIGTTFTLGGSTAQVQTELNGNTGAYRYYQLVKQTGAVSSGPWIHEFEFKIDDASANVVAGTWTHSQSYGARTGTITTTTTATLGGGDVITDLVDGIVFTSTLNWVGGQSGKEIKFDFVTARVVVEAKWIQSTTDSHGTWQWAGSNDDATYTDIGATFTLGGAKRQYITTLSGNTTAYRYYRLLSTAGSTNGSPILQEMLFKIASPTPPVPTATGNLAFSGISYAGAGTLVVTGTGNLTFGGIAFAGNAARTETGSGALTFGGIAFAGAGQVIHVKGTGNLAFSGISYIGVGYDPGIAGTGLRQFSTFG